jgi:sugar/nucleoside kinase (ribokinase family)
MRCRPFSPEALCIGHAAYDLSLFTQGFPIENTKSETNTLLEAGGGPAANAAYLLSSWGVSCAFAGLLGDDHFGRLILAEFAACGTDVSLVEVRLQHATPLSIILVNVLNGSRTLINRKAKTGYLRLNPAALARLSPQVLLFDGHELEASLLALECFPKAITILDAGSLREGTSVLAGKVDYLVASEKFGLQVCGLKALNSKRARYGTVRQLKERYDNTVVVTLGERGLIGDAGNGYFEVPAFRAKAMDTTGAGDIFHGAFVYAIARRMDLMDALRLASMAASLSVRRRGGRASIPRLTEVTEALRNA